MYFLTVIYSKFYTVIQKITDFSVYDGNLFSFD